MPKVSLTDRAVSAAKAKPGQRLEMHDALTPGLTLRVTDKGVKSWVLRYRTQAGASQRFKLGDPKTLSLRAARLEAGRLKADIDKGLDPLETKRAAREQAKAITVRTFDDLLAAYWTACEAGTWKPKRKRKRPQTLAYEKRLADRHIGSDFRSLSLASIKRGTVATLLAEMLNNGIGAQTNRVHAIVRQAFNFALANDFAAMNPALNVPSPHDNVPRRRIWPDDALAKLWAACSDSSGLRDADGKRVYVSRQVGIAVQLSVLLLQRRVEIAHMAVSEVDLEAGTWIIPGERMKAGRPHQVPLPPRAIALIRESLAITAERTKDPVTVVFPSPKDLASPIREDALTKAVARIRGALGLEDVTVHDLRRTGSTIMTSERLGVSPFIRSKVLGHGTDAGGGAAVSSIHYDANEYVSEKRRALEAWEGLLLEIVRERPRPSNVAPIRGAA